MPRSGEWSREGGQRGVGMSIRGRCPGGKDTGLEGDLGAQHIQRSGCEEAKAQAGGWGADSLGEPLLAVRRTFTEAAFLMS